MNFPEIASRKWWRETIKLIFSLHDIQVVTKRGKKGRAIYSDKNVVIELPDSSGDDETYGLQMFELQSESDDWNVCRPLSIDADGLRATTSVDYYIAKPPELRHSIVSETINGAVFTYTYTDEHTRIMTAEDDSTETQVVTPWYLPTGGSVTIIYAQAVVGGTGVWKDGVQLTLLEQSSRAWARQDASPP